EKYIVFSYNYFYENINVIQFDKFKVSKSLSLMNSLLIKKKKYPEALIYNSTLLTKFKSLLELNRFNYEDFIPQINSQIAEVYLNTSNYDSAIHFSNNVLAVMFPKAAQYGVSYIGSLNGYLLQACYIRLKQNNYRSADSLALRYIESLSIENTLDPFVKEYMQTQVGDFIVSTAELFYKFTDETFAIDSLSKVNKILFPKIDRYLQLADQHYKLALEKTPALTYRYAKYLLRYCVFINKWVSTCLDKIRYQEYNEK